MLLKLYIYGYLNRVQSSRRLEREACRNVEVMWLAGRLVIFDRTFGVIGPKREPRPGAERSGCCPRPAPTRVFGSGRRYSTAATVTGALSEDYHCLRWEFETLLGGAQMWPTFNQLIAAATGRRDYG